MKKIFVVDKDLKHLDYCHKVLQELGYEVAVASSRKEFLEVVYQPKFDLMLMDCFIPLTDVFACILTAKSINSKMGTILMSDQVLTEEQTELANDIADGLLLKPFDPDILEETVNQYFIQAAVKRYQINNYSPLVEEKTNKIM